MSWVTYTLVGVSIIVLIICIVYLSRPYIREGLLDYFDIEDYLTATGTQNTVGKYVVIYPSDLGVADNSISFSQIQVFDMNGTNIGRQGTVSASSTKAGSANVTTTIDGTVTLRTGNNAWQSGPGGHWRLDLGRLYQISRVSVIGRSDTNLTLKGMKVFIVDKLESVNKKNCPSSTCQFMTFGTSDNKQSIIFPNNINLTPGPVDPSYASPFNVNIIPMTNTQPEVFLVGPAVPGSSAEGTCANIGARLATKGQLEYAARKGALWSQYGWVKDSSNVLTKPYRIVKNTSPGNTTGNSIEESGTNITSGSGSGSGTGTGSGFRTAMVNCFGIKSDRGSSSKISTDFNSEQQLWSEYDNTTLGRKLFFGTEDTIPVPDVEVIKKNLIMFTDPDFTIAASNSAPNTYISIPKEAPNTWSGIDGSYSIIKGGAVVIVSQKIKDFYTMLLKNAAYTFASDINYSTDPKNIYDLSSADTGITVFGTVDIQAKKDMAKSLEYSRRIFVGSPSDVDRFINVQYIDANTGSNSSYKATFRNSNGYNTYCKAELDLSGFNPSRYGFNLNNCSTELTPTVLALIPDPTRNFIIDWIYNRTQLFIEKKVYYFENPSKLGRGAKVTITDELRKIAEGLQKMYAKFGRNVSVDDILNDVKLVPPTAAEIAAARATMNTELAAVKKLKADIKIDITNEKVLNSIAQSFYEALGGNYVMSNIYDIYTIGNTILDIRFDLTKHGDIGPFQTKVAKLNQEYNDIRSSNLAQGVLDNAKYDYETAMDDIQFQETYNTYNPVLGVVGRFFYRYDTSSGNFTITGFTLNAKAATSFIPELNGGTRVSVGSEIGNLNFIPTIKYTLNVPESLDCTNPNTLRRIMDDYVYATGSDLEYALYSATPSMDITQGSVKVREILGAVQVAPTQCAITWKESLWDAQTNGPISDKLNNVKRSALISYSVNQDDWYSSQINFDPSGFAFFSSNKVPSCKFDTEAYKAKIAPRLSSASKADIQRDFLQGTFNRGYTPVCPKTLPKYLFNPSDYVAAHGDLKALPHFMDPTSGIVNVTEALKHYTSTGTYTNSGIYEERVIRASEDITAFPRPIILKNPFPGGTLLDDGNSVCPVTSCEDFDTLYSIVQQYNNDPTSPGTILRVTKSNTPNKFQCDIQADIDYDINVRKLSLQPGSESEPVDMVQKGSFSYDSAGVPQDNPTPPPSGLQKNATLGLGVHMDIKTCSIQYDTLVDDGYSIQTNTPPLPKPMEYATEVQKRETASMTTSFNNIKSSAGSALTAVKSVLPTYKTNTVNAQDAIATLGTNCASKCDSTDIVNNMLQFYKDQNRNTKIIDSVLRVKTLDSSTCEMTFKELTPIPDQPTIMNAKTTGARFKMGSGGDCKFYTVSMIYAFPSISIPDTMPFAAPNWWSNPPTYTAESYNTKEVFAVKGPLTQTEAQAKCASYGATLATYDQVVEVEKAGGGWCSWGWIADDSSRIAKVSFPVQATDQCYNDSPGTKVRIQDGSTERHGANCYGVKPGMTDALLPFSSTKWSQTKIRSSMTFPYSNPYKETFTNYKPIQVTESTFPLNKSSFGLDIARNNDGPGLDTLFIEPLRQESRAVTVGPKYVDADETLQGEKASSYKYIRFRPTKTRDPSSPVNIAKIRFFLKGNEIDIRTAKVTNPMGTWVGDVADVNGPGYTRGWSDKHKRALMFAFPYALMMDGFSWTTADPDKGIGGDPVQWKLEGSSNGTYWTTLRDQSHKYPVPVNRFQDLPVFRF